MEILTKISEWDVDLRCINCPEYLEKYKLKNCGQIQIIEDYFVKMY